MELAWTEIKGPRGSRRVRVFIDRPARPDRPDEPVGLADCERVNERLSELCDLEDPIPGSWTLEVSTPGLDRPLFSLEQCRRFVGRQVRVRQRPEGSETARPPTSTGTILSAEGGTLLLETAAGPAPIEWRRVERARLVPDFDALLGGRSAGRPDRKPDRKPGRRPGKRPASRSAANGSGGSGKPGGRRKRRPDRGSGAAAAGRSPA